MSEFDSGMMLGIVVSFALMALIAILSPAPERRPEWRPTPGPKNLPKGGSAACSPARPASPSERLYQTDKPPVNPTVIYKGFRRIPSPATPA